MPGQDREFQLRLLAIFREEALEHVRAISSGLIELENTRELEQRAGIVERIFREAHSLKGASRAANQKEIEAVCQSAEATLAKAKRREAELDSQALDALHQAMDEVERLLVPGREAGPALAPAAAAATAAAAPAAEYAAQPETEVRLQAAEQPKGAGPTVRISEEQLDQLLIQVEELIPVSGGGMQASAGQRELARDLSRWKRQWAKAQPIARSLRLSLDQQGAAGNGTALKLRRLLDFLEWNVEFTGTFEARLNLLSRSMERDQRALKGMVDSLLRDSKLLLLRPFSSILQAFPRFVRDLCRQQGKDAALSVRGAELEIDRRILQEIKDPLLHLLRNCIDHGIETLQERAQANKPNQGELAIAIQQISANQVEIAISDDGGGIDPRKVREAAVREGLVSAESAQALSDEEALGLIFQSGLTTSSSVTEISGRGLGMAIVRDKVEKLGGTVGLSSRLGAGSTIRLLLPLTVSTIRGLLVRAGEQRLLIPLSFVERVASEPKQAIQTVADRSTVVLEGFALSLVGLAQVLGIPAAEHSGSARMPMVVLSMAERRIAFRVDEVIGEQEVLVKALGPQLQRVRNIMGAAVLSTGGIVPILNVPDLMKSAVKAEAAPGGEPEPEQPSEAAQRPILVVEDSITARTLLKSILEAAGYKVRTAVDGAEAFAALRELRPALVVSDIDMPRLNGFDLTAKIRADKLLSELPVILVTALESRQDRERGIEVGANAYIVKSSFEQNHLLEIVRRYV